MIVLDTTVLVYCLGRDHPLREPSREIIRHAVRLGATTSAEVIQEFTHVFARRRDRAVAAAFARDYLRLLTPLLSPDERSVSEGLDLFVSTPGLGSFDCLLAAASRARGAVLVSADSGFGAVEGLVYVRPGSPEAAALLS